MSRYLLVYCLISTLNAFAQGHIDVTPTDTVVHRNRYAVKIGAQIEGSDSIPVFLFKRFVIKGTHTKEEIDNYKNLVRWVRNALPYAKMAAYRLQVMEDNLRLISSEKEKKKYIKSCEKDIKEMFMDDLKDLYVMEGRILLKLIYRETGKSTWDIMQKYGGSFETLFYQAIAKSYDADMKSTYDPILDYQLEEIIKSIEAENAR